MTPNPVQAFPCPQCGGTQYDLFFDREINDGAGADAATIQSIGHSFMVQKYPSMRIQWATCSGCQMSTFVPYESGELEVRGSLFLYKGVVVDL